jgi:hypothetical protein
MQEGINFNEDVKKQNGDYCEFHVMQLLVLHFLRTIKMLTNAEHLHLFGKHLLVTLRHVLEVIN